MHDTAAPWAEASSLLASLFYEFLGEEGVTFEEFESRSISYGHAAIADATPMALECKDKSLCAGLPDGCKVHDRRPKTPASEVGDLSLSYRRVRDACGNTVVPLADHLDLPWCARVTPGARSFWLGALACAFANLVLMEHGANPIVPRCSSRVEEKRVTGFAANRSARARIGRKAAM